ncbi:MAG: alkaline phosphatase family protein [Gammaproteobacteria bacterium]
MSDSRQSRLMMIGLDACDRDLIDTWCASGDLENIAKLRAEGVWLPLQTTADVVHVSAWPSIFTGTPADQHGLYHAYVMQPGHQTPVRPRPDNCPVPFLWKLLDDHGKRCIVMDAFLTCPLKNFSGIQIVDWGSWTAFWDQTILPESVKSEMLARFGAYASENHSKVGMTPPPDPVGFRDRLLKSVETKARAIQWLAETQQWDFFLAVFGECHAAGHYFWHYQDPAYVAYARDADARLRTALRDVYVALDRAIGQMVRFADDRTTVLVLSGDGMGPNYSGSHLLEELLQRMRLLNDTPREATAGAAPASAKRKTNLLSTIRGLVPREFRAAVSRHLLPRSVNERLSLHWKTAGIDWARTRAFVIENANEGYLRLNLRDREPSGVVQPGAEYAEICDRLAATAATMTHPATGRLAASHVYKTDDIFKGPCRSAMPDVIINWDPEALVTTDLQTQNYGVIHRDQAAYEVGPFYTGNHRPTAFLGGIGPRLSRAAGAGDASILSIAPTALAHLGVEPGEHMAAPIIDGLT